MMRFLSLAWWGQNLASAPVVAGAIAASLALVMMSLVGGALWIHHQGAVAERAQCTAERAVAKTRADAEMAERVRLSEDIARRRRAELLDELNEQRLRMEELEVALASKPRNVCFSKEVAKRLNDGRR